ncbi:hypothetical protein C8R46DRAFT_899542 [Mycena filopes]|nr:hypothetical protein C8R46DRAFT_899542 [Mycena filopes]
MYSVTAYTLTPLLLFHNLVRVSLFHAGGFEIDDSTIMEMARAWPRIQHLALKADRICRTEPQVTLHGLLAFATHCPVLQSLNITLDATGAVPKLRSRDFVSQHSLEVLHVVHSPVAEPLRAVAQFVGAIFPQLREITTLHADLPPQMTNPMLAGSHKVWMKVQKALCQEPWGGLDLKSS